MIYIVPSKGIYAFIYHYKILSCLLCIKEENLNIKSIIILNALYTEFMNVSGILSDKIEL